MRQPHRNLDQKYQYSDLLKFQDASLYSSIGNLVDSKKKTAPKYSFGTSTRDAYLKRFGTKQLPEDPSIGKNLGSPERADKIVYHRSPRCKIGTGLKNSLDKIQQYDYYRRKDLDFDLNEAENIKKRRISPVKFTGEKRFPQPKEKTPGPGSYMTIDNPQKSTNKYKYSIVPKRSNKKEDPLIFHSSTSQVLGPGTYLIDESHKMSQQTKKNVYSIGNARRNSFVDKKRVSYNESYDLSQSMGPQLISKKGDSPNYKIPKEKREDGKRSSMFEAHMEFKPSSVKISLPKI